MGQIPPGSFRKLNGEIEPCLIDCRSIDLCVRGLLSCRATDGRQAQCRWASGGGIDLDQNLIPIYFSVSNRAH